MKKIMMLTTALLTLILMTANCFATSLPTIDTIDNNVTDDIYVHIESVEIGDTFIDVGIESNVTSNIVLRTLTAEGCIVDSVCVPGNTKYTITLDYNRFVTTVTACVIDNSGYAVAKDQREINATTDFLPLRKVFEAAGYDVTWNDVTREIIMSGYYKIMTLYPGDYALLYGKAYIPAEMVSELLPNVVSQDMSCYTYQMSDGIYKIYLSLDTSKEATQIEASITDNDGMVTILYSDGVENLGGPFTTLIEITVEALRASVAMG